MGPQRLCQACRSQGMPSRAAEAWSADSFVRVASSTDSLGARPPLGSASHRKCDDGVRLDTGEDCENCGNVIHLRRARRARIGADIDRELPGLAHGERRPS
ncbi:hypothetical protein DDE05_25855 [Streptomyces cavourensis]|nr:hypothetical protein DDE05_25855 [Streptomyces cavourensis]